MALFWGRGLKVPTRLLSPPSLFFVFWGTFFTFWRLLGAVGFGKPRAREHNRRAQKRKEGGSIDSLQQRPERRRAMAA
jgi:hypothetical protein